MNHPAFGVDNFEEPKVLSESESLVHNIFTIIFAKKGSFPSIPELGLYDYIYDLLHSFSDDIDTSELEEKLIEQCSDLGESIDDGVLSISSILDGNGNPAISIMVKHTKYTNSNTIINLSISTGVDGKIIYDLTTE